MSNITPEELATHEPTCDGDFPTRSVTTAWAVRCLGCGRTLEQGGIVYSELLSARDRAEAAEEIAAEALERERGARARVRELEATLLAPFGVADYKVWTDAQYRGDDALASDPPATEPTND